MNAIRCVTDPIRITEVAKVIDKNSFSSFQAEKEDFDPFADRRRPTVAEKEDEYRQKRRRLVISPERADPFADGLYFCYFFILIFLKY